MVQPKSASQPYEKPRGGRLKSPAGKRDFKGQASTAMSPELLKMVAYCLAPIDEARARVLREFDPPADWEDFCRFCLERGVLNLVYAKLKRAGREEIIPPPLREKMSRFYMNIAIHNELKLKSVVPVSALFNKKGMDFLFIKGAGMLLAGDYCDFGERIASDVDVLVPESHRAEADRTLAELEEWTRSNPNETRPTVESKWLNKWGVLIELHSRLLDLNGIPAETPMNRLWNNAQEVHSNGAAALIPAREDRFIQSAIHFAAHHSFDLAFMLICIADLAHIAGKPGKTLDWEAIHRRLQQERMLEHGGDGSGERPAGIRTDQAGDGIYELTRARALKMGGVPDSAAVLATFGK